MSSHKIGGFSDFSSSNTVKKSSTFHELDDKEWRTSNPSIQDRITDITSKVKTILENSPQTRDNNLEFSDNEEELGHKHDHKPKPDPFTDLSSKRVAESKVGINY